jgi:paraquat-inducible protein B
MSQRANPTMIGAFIVAGLALGVAGLLAFSSFRLFSASTKFIIYFNSSLNGLSKGAPVKYRGVTIGSVDRVMIHYNQDVKDDAMPVIIEIQERLVRERLDKASLFEGLNDLGEQVRKGLRASLETESLLTGVLYVNLEILRDAPPAVYHQWESLYFEIPSRATDIQEFMKNLAGMDIAGLEKSINSLITKIDATLGDLKVGELSAGMRRLMDSVDRIASSPELKDSIADLKTTLGEYRRLAEKLNGHIDPILNDFRGTLAEANKALAQIQGGMVSVRGLLAPDSPMRHDLTVALEQAASAAQAISALAEFLERHPNALVAGREAAEKSK